MRLTCLESPALAGKRSLSRKAQKLVVSVPQSCPPDLNEPKHEAPRRRSGLQLSPALWLLWRCCSQHPCLLGRTKEQGLRRRNRAISGCLFMMCSAVTLLLLPLSPHAPGRPFPCITLVSPDTFPPCSVSMGFVMAHMCPWIPALKMGLLNSIPRYSI